MPTFQLYPAISVIIPLYNSERYVADCLNSLLAQTFPNFEVIIVDDCSTDSSCAVVESFVERFGGRLTLAHMEENSGQGSLPRNRGLMFSRGEYVFFMDNDDLLTKTALEEMYTLARKFDADVVYLDGRYIAADDLKEIKPADYKLAVSEPTLESEALPERIKRIGQGRYTLPPWNKFVRRRLLVENKISFPRCKIFEDDIWTYGLLFYAKNFLCVPNKVYIHRKSEGSITCKGKTPLQTINFRLRRIRNIATPFWICSCSGSSTIFFGQVSTLHPQTFTRRLNRNTATVSANTTCLSPRWRPRSTRNKKSTSAISRSSINLPRRLKHALHNLKLN